MVLRKEPSRSLRFGYNGDVWKDREKSTGLTQPYSLPKGTAKTREYSGNPLLLNVLGKEYLVFSPTSAIYAGLILEYIDSFPIQ